MAHHLIPMKTRLVTLLAAFLICATAGAINVRFNLTDFLTTSQPLIRRTVVVEPQSAPLASGTNVVVQERRFFNTGTTGQFTATNVVEGTYRCIVYGQTYTNVFRINVPAASGETNASAILISAADSGIETEDGRSIDIE